MSYKITITITPQEYDKIRPLLDGQSRQSKYYHRKKEESKNNVKETEVKDVKKSKKDTVDKKSTNSGSTSRGYLISFTNINKKERNAAFEFTDSELDEALSLNARLEPKVAKTFESYDHLQDWVAENLSEMKPDDSGSWRYA